MASWPVAIADDYMERFKNRAPSLYKDFIGGRTEHSPFFKKKLHSGCWDTDIALHCKSSMI